MSHLRRADLPQRQSLVQLSSAPRPRVRVAAAAPDRSNAIQRQPRTLVGVVARRTAHSPREAETGAPAHQTARRQPVAAGLVEREVGTRLFHCVYSGGAFNHWLAWNIPAKPGALPEGSLPEGAVPKPPASAAELISAPAPLPVPGTITTSSSSTHTARCWTFPRRHTRPVAGRDERHHRGQVRVLRPIPSIVAFGAEHRDPETGRCEEHIASKHARNPSVQKLPRLDCLVFHGVVMR